MPAGTGWVSFELEAIFQACNEGSDSFRLVVGYASNSLGVGT